MIKLSVIVPVYNVKLLLNRCLDSLLSTNVDNVEILLINDGSTDGSDIICKEYEQKYNNVRFLSLRNGGVSHARNVGIENARGEFVVFVDSDDFVNPAYLNDLLVYSNDYDYIVSEIILYNPYKLIKRNQISIFHIPLDEGDYSYHEYVSILPQMGISPLIGAPYAKLFRKSILDNFKIRFNESTCYAEDLEFNLEYLIYVKKIYVSKKSGYIYWKTIGNTLSRRKYDFQYMNNRWHTLLKKYNSVFERAMSLDKSYFSRVLNLSKKIVVSTIAAGPISEIASSIFSYNNYLKDNWNESEVSLIRSYIAYFKIRTKELIRKQYRILQRIVYTINAEKNGTRDA